MAEECICKAEDIILLPCSGGSNCGQITNQVAVNLDIEGVGRISLKTCDIVCAIGLFIFGWLIGYVYQRAGKKKVGKK